MKHDNIICRYGLFCKKIQEGTCQFRHPEAEGRKEERQRSNVRGKKPHMERSRSRSKEEKRQYKRHNREENNKYHFCSKRQTSKDKNDKISPSTDHQNRRKKHKNNHHPHQSYQSQRRYYQQKPSQKQNAIQSPPLSITERLFATFCKSYHVDDKCDDIQHCKKRHAFLFKDYNRIKRLIFRKDILLSPKSKLSLYQQNGNIYYIIKGVSKLILYAFAPDKSQLRQVRSVQLHLQKQLQIDYFKNSGTMLYFSLVNQITSFYDLSICDAISNKSCSIKNAHLNQVTGMIHISQQQIVSVSLDGDLKVWTVTKQNSFINDKQKTARFKELYNPNNLKMGLNFIQMFRNEQITYILVGSNNSKLFLFTSDVTSAFKEIVLCQQQLNIVKIKCIMNRGVIEQIVVLAKNYEKSLIFKAKLADLKFQMIFQQSNHNNRSVTTFQIYQDLLMVSCASQVVFYRLPNTKVTIGGIYHRTAIKNIVISQYELQSTAVKFPMMAILQTRAEECKESGSFSIYLIK